MNISVVIPLYNEEDSLLELCTWVEKVMKEHMFSYEILLIDDGSKDNSWNVIKKISSKNAGQSWNPTYKMSRFMYRAVCAVSSKNMNGNLKF